MNTVVFSVFGEKVSDRIGKVTIDVATPGGAGQPPSIGGFNLPLMPIYEQSALHSTQ